MKKSFLSAFMFLLMLSLVCAQSAQGQVVASWGFDEPPAGLAEIEDTEDDEDDEDDEGGWGMYTLEKKSGIEYDITGLAKLVPGVNGTAIKFDGFSSYIEGNPFRGDEGEEEEEGENDEPGRRFRMPREISIETWVSIGAYPWNWAPILTIGKYKVTGFYFGIDSRGCPGFHMSDATSVWHECNAPVNPETKAG